jgi:hypothetical protein
MVDEVIRAIIQAARTGEIRDGGIFVTRIPCRYKSHMWLAATLDVTDLSIDRRLDGGINNYGVRDVARRHGPTPRAVREQRVLVDA